MARRTRPLEKVQNPDQQDSFANDSTEPTNVTDGSKHIPGIQLDTGEEKWRANQRCYWNRQIRVAKWMNWLTFGAVFVGAVGLYFVNESLKVTGVAADAARIQAESSSKQVSLMKEPIRARLDIRVERARHITPNIPAPYEPHLPIPFNVHVKNTGGSPVLTYNWVGETGMCDDIMSKECLQIQSLSFDDTNEGVIGVEGTKYFTLLLPAQSPEIIDALKSGKKTVYVYGKVRYQDIFAEWHIREFCVFDLFLTQNTGDCPTHNADG